MTSVCRDIFRAVHEGKWLSIEYRNKDGKVTKYWISIQDIDLKRRMLRVDGLHLREMATAELVIYIDSILSSSVLEGTYCAVNQRLVEDIALRPEKYTGLFDNIPNLKILNYLSDCNRLDATPYSCEYALIRYFDGDDFSGGSYALGEEQFEAIVRHFQYKAAEEDSELKIRQLGLNVMSIPTKQGLYVLAYRKMFLDITARSLRPDDKLTLCREFTISGEKMSIRRFLDDDDMDLLDDFEENLETIKDVITVTNAKISGVDDMPYLIAIGMDIPLDLEREYATITGMYNADKVTAPIQAFFGDLLKRPVRRKSYPIALLDRRVNLDQLLAINNAMRFPLAYIQGPPGTGKTNTILNTIMTAFFNGRTVLFVSYNNHPIDSVFKKLRGLTYRGQSIPFPIVRLGNNDKVARALDDIRDLYERTRDVRVFDSTLDNDRNSKIARAQQLTKLLSDYEEVLDLRERRETVEHLLSENHQLNFQAELQGRQLVEIDARLSQIGNISNSDALELIDDGGEEFRKYLYYTSAKTVKRLGEPKYKELLDIVLMDSDNPERVSRFNSYLSRDENVEVFLRIFPIVSTTCISAHKIGEPRQYFDMIIMDEASQCNTAVSLVPILRGDSLMLVGDPQQLDPVILLDPADNQVLRKKYGVSEEYDYIQNSIYKTYLACDSVSDEVLLRYHYRCHKKIIDFNNRKYYNGKLTILSASKGERPLLYVDVTDSDSAIKNTAPGEADQIVEYVKRHPGENLGIITPFANQRALINERLRDAGMTRVNCGTVHAFQGDEKDVILFSLGLSDETRQKTYDWLKNNRELINVATSRAKDRLIVLGSGKNLRRLHNAGEQDDLFELVEYIRSNGESQVTQRTALSRALGIKPYSSETEAAFMENLNHAIDNILPSGNRYIVRKEVPVSQVFRNNTTYSSLFYTGRFDFVVYERSVGRNELPVLAIELDGREHFEDSVVRERDRRKNAICRDHGFELIRVENTYARRYHYIKDILIRYFTAGRMS